MKWKIEPLYITVDGENHKVDTDFRTILNEPRGLELLIPTLDPSFLSIAEYEGIVNFIKKELMLDADEDKKTKEKIFDFDEDNGAIISAFYSNYNIDLTSIEFLDFRLFVRLLGGLHGTQFNKLIELSTMKIPKQTKNNAEQIKEMKRIKQERLNRINKKENEEKKKEQIKKKQGIKITRGRM